MDASILDRLYKVIESRKGANPSSSNTARLFAKGTEKIAQKLGEEAVETDLLYHLLVLWADRDLKPAEVWQTQAEREGISGLEEKKSRKN